MPRRLTALQPQARDAGRLLLAAWLGDASVQPARRLLAAAGVPAYATPEAAVQAFLDIVSFKRRQQALQQVCPSAPPGPAPEREAAARLVATAVASGPLRLDEARARPLLAAYGLPPFATGRPPASSLELVLAMALDSTFGPVLRLAQGAPGRGLIGPPATALPPLNAALAMAMLQETPLGHTLLRSGDRQLPEADPVLEALVRLSDLVVDRPEIAGIELELRLAAERGLETLSAWIDLVPVPPGTDPTGRLAIRPYPVELEEEVTAEDGQRFRLRPIRPEDAAALQRGFKRLSADDVRRRFFAPVAELTPEVAARLSQIDYDREMVLVIEDPASPATSWAVPASPWTRTAAGPSSRPPSAPTSRAGASAASPSSASSSMHAAAGWRRSGVPSSPTTRPCRAWPPIWASPCAAIRTSRTW